MNDKSELTFLFEQNDDNTEIMLTLLAKEPMTDEEYILALEDFVDSLKEGQVYYLNEATKDVH